MESEKLVITSHGTETSEMLWMFPRVSFAFQLMCPCASVARPSQVLETALWAQSTDEKGAVLPMGCGASQKQEASWDEIDFLRKKVMVGR